MFHIHAVNDNAVYTIRSHARMRNTLLLIVHYPHVSTDVVIIIGVIYTVTRSPNRLLKCISEPLTVTDHVSDFLHIY
jgi:hypothetical protein